MLVSLDMEETLSRYLKPAPTYEWRDCGECEKGGDRAVCAKCIQAYLDYRQTVENIRRM